MAALPRNWLATVPYTPPETPESVTLDLVTPTRNRKAELLANAMEIAVQLTANDRWIVVDDASSDETATAVELVQCLASPAQLLHIAISYARGQDVATVNRARHLGVSSSRPDAWVVEVDDHDILFPSALALVRQAICRGAVFIYGDVRWAANGKLGEVWQKPDYVPYLFRSQCVTEGVRAYPRWLYDAVGGYRWHGPLDVGGNEFPGGDYGLFLRMESLCEGQGFYRIPHVLNVQPKSEGSISTRYGGQQFEMAQKLRKAAEEGTL